MVILYIISLCILLYSISLHFKSNILDNLITSFIYVLVLDVVLSYVCLLLKCKVSDLFLVILYSLFSIFLLSLHRKSKKKLVFTISAYEIIYTTILITSVIFILYYRFNNASVIAFETTDPVVHYDMFKSFYLNQELLISAPSKIYPWMSDYPSLFYVNAGIFYRIFSFIADWKFYIYFNLFLLILASYKFYKLLLLTTVNNVIKSVFAMFMATYFCWSYTVNLVMFGFSSQLIVLVVILEFCTVLIGMSQDNSEMNKITTINVIKINVLLTGVIVGYYYYLPEIIVSFCIFIIVKKRIYSVKDICISVILPTLFFIIIFLIFKAHPKGGESALLKSEGYIFRDLYSSIILPLSATIVLFYLCIRNKTYDFLFVLTMISFAFSLILFVMCLFNIASSYYYYKNYLMLYILTLLNFYIFIAETRSIYNWFMLLLFSIILLIGVQYVERFRLASDSEIIHNLLPNQNMLLFNFQHISKANSILTNKQINYISHDVNCNVFYKTRDVLQSLWIYSISGCYPKYFRTGDELQNISVLYNNDNIVPNISGIKIVDFESKF